MKYRDWAIAYLDILGFKALSGDPYKLEYYVKAHETVASHLVNFGPDEDGYFDEDTPVRRVFTDNVILAYPIVSIDGETEIGSLIQDVALYQTHFAYYGFFMRGGMTIGRLFANMEVMIGEALLEAYKLESESAFYPRVILSNDVLNRIKDFEESNDKLWADDMLLQDRDDHVFVNYLAVLNHDESIMGAHELLHSHGGHIVDELVTKRSYNRIIEQYIWLAEYHNAFVQSIEGAKDSELLIALSDTLEQPRFRIVKPPPPIAECQDTPSDLEFITTTEAKKSFIRLQKRGLSVDRAVDILVDGATYNTKFFTLVALGTTLLDIGACSQTFLEHVERADLSCLSPEEESSGCLKALDSICAELRAWKGIDPR